jgi:hypothetical protein
VNVLKNISLGLLSFLLFSSLLFFGFAFMLNTTVLNPRFITSEIDRLDIALIAEEVLDDEVSSQELTVEVRTEIVDDIETIEPLLEEQIGKAINSVYDYLLAKTTDLDFAKILRDTVLSTDFINTVMDKVDLSFFISEIIVDQISEEMPPELEYMVEYFDEYMVGYFDEYVDNVVEKNKAWINEQIKNIVEPSLDYLMGVRSYLNVEISLTTIVESLKDELKEPFLASPPAQLANLTQISLEKEYDDFFKELAFNPTFELDESSFGTDTQVDITEAISEAEETFELMRQGIGYFKLVYVLLIVFILVLIVGIVLISRDVKYITRSLGISLIIYGAIEFIGILVTRYVIWKFTPLSDLALSDVPSSLEPWIQQFISNLVEPLQWFSLGMLIVGVALVVVSYVYKREQPSLEASQYPEEDSDQ